MTVRVAAGAHGTQSGTPILISNMRHHAVDQRCVSAEGSGAGLLAPTYVYIYLKLAICIRVKRSLSVSSASLQKRPGWARISDESGAGRCMTP
ncbi:hypothetical protein SLA2020_226360 [Shorea laevis]